MGTNASKKSTKQANETDCLPKGQESPRSRAFPETKKGEERLKHSPPFPI